MQDIPNEILNQIFDLLSQEDQLECMLVCHLWKDIIENHSLFRDLRIYSSDSLESFINKIQENPSTGRNVKQLTCYFNRNTEVNLTKLLEPLCNLQTFDCFGPEYGDLLFDDGMNFSWRTSIETFSQQFFYPIIHSIIKTNIFPRLTVLDVCDIGDKLLPQSFKNTPALKNLTLRFGDISFIKLNTLHDSLPNLNILTLEYKSFLGDTFYKYTAPAKSITEFSLASITTRTIQQRLDMLEYIKVKYPNLTHLKLDSDFFGTCISEKEQFYNQGWEPLLRNLGSQLTEIQVFYLDEVQSFLNMLDKTRCQIQTLNLSAGFLRNDFPNIAQSQQSLYIRTLILNQIEPGSFEWLREFKVLESLDIEFDLNDGPVLFNFNNFVEHCPDSLLLLSIANAKVTTELINAIQCNVETLTLAYCTLPKKIDWFISRHFSLLSAFTLDNCTFRTRKFDIKVIDLQTFCLFENRSGEAVTVMVKTYHNFEERWYSTKGDEHYYPFTYQLRTSNPKNFPRVISLPASEVKENPFFTLYCHTMRQIFLCR